MDSTLEKQGKQEVAPKEDKPDYYSLRFRSTGLGKTMLEGEPAEVMVVDDMLVMHIQSTTPVRWRIRAALSYRGLLKFIKLGLKLSVIKFMLFGFKTMKKPKLSDEF
ncbi:MAG: hypothetical protein ABII96_00030 [Candidatus Zixiibacteriota bacterium]